MSDSARIQPMLSIVVPAYNEEATLSEVVAQLLAVSHAGEIVIVDDCSTDRTGAIADRLAAKVPRVKVAHHSVNRGNTEALKTGKRLALSRLRVLAWGLRYLGNRESTLR